MRVPGRKQFTHAVTAHCWRGSVHLARLPEEDSWKLVPGFLQTSHHAPFPLADFALYPFTVINDSLYAMTI